MPSDRRYNTVQCLVRLKGVKTQITPAEKIFLLTNIVDYGTISADKDFLPTMFIARRSGVLARPTAK